MSWQNAFHALSLILMRSVIYGTANQLLLNSKCVILAMPWLQNKVFPEPALGDHDYLDTDSRDYSDLGSDSIHFAVTKKGSKKTLRRNLQSYRSTPVSLTNRRKRHFI